METTGKFKIGDRVVLIKEFPNIREHTPRIGQIGTVIESAAGNDIGVEFDEEFKGGHKGYKGTGKPGHCWNFPEENYLTQYKKLEEDGNYW